MVYSTAYTTEGVVQGLVDHVFDGGFTTTTNPTAAQVTGMISGISAVIDAHLLARGIPVPLIAPDVMVEWVSQVCAWGVAAQVLKSFSPETQVATNGGSVIPAYAYYQKLFDQAMTDVQTGYAVLDQDPTRARSFFTDNPDGYIVELEAIPAGHGEVPHFSMNKVF
jgi:hypothetical protein